MFQYLLPGYNHFEMRLIDNISPDKPPPAIVLSTATPLEPTPMTNFKLDFLRFWAMNDRKFILFISNLLSVLSP